MKTSDTSAVVLFMQTMLQIERGEIYLGTKTVSDLRNEACQRFRESVREEPVGVAPYRRRGDRPEVDYEAEYKALYDEVKKLQDFIGAPVPQGFMGVDMNSILYKISKLLEGRKP